MKSIVITAPDDIFSQTVDALAYSGGYRDVVEDNDNLKLAFAKEELIKLLADRVKDYARMTIRQQAMMQTEKVIETTIGQISAYYPDIKVEIKDE